MTSVARCACALVAFFGLAASPAFALVPADNRVYEMVSPVDKHFAGVFPNKASTQSSLAGDRIAYYSVGAFAGSSGANQINGYLASRGSGGWATTPLTPPQAGAGVNLNAGPKLFSEDLSHWVVAAWGGTSPLTAIQVPNILNLFVQRVATPAEFESITFDAGGSPAGPDPSISYPADFSADSTKVVFQSPLTFTAGAVAGVDNAYAYDSGSHELALVGILPDGSPAPEGSAVGQSARSGSQTNYSRNAVSADAERIYFTAQSTPSEGDGSSGVQQVYLRRGLATTTRVSGSELAVPEASQAATFQDAGEDGRSAFFLTRERMTSDDTGSGLAEDSADDLYMYEDSADPVSDQNLTLISRDSTPADGAKVRGTVAISQDARRVYFVAAETLLPEAPSGPPGLYLWDDGDLRFIGALNPSEIGFTSDNVLSNVANARTARVSDDGRFLALISSAQLSGDDNGDLPQVYLYDAAADGGTGRWSCASCPPDGSAPTHQAALAAAESGFNAELVHLSRSLLPGASRLYLQTAESLVPEDGNGVSDVYQYDVGSGGLALISSGGGDHGSTLADVSADGSDVFFFTADRLVGADRDDSIDLYDARAGGGFAEPEPGRPECLDDACQGPVSGAPASVAPASSSIGAADRSRSRSQARRRCRRHAGAVRKADRLRKHAGKHGKRAGRCRGGAGR